MPAPRCPAALPACLSVRCTRATWSTSCALSLVVLRVLIRLRLRAPMVSCPGQAVRGMSLPAVISLTMPVYAQQFAYISNRIRCIKVMTGNGPFLA